MSLGSRYSQHSFAQIPQVNIGRSKFDRSFTVKDTFDFDYLIPFLIDEVLPGDTYNVNVNVFGRLATQIVPIMDNMYLDFFFFFVPNRLVWDNWEKFNGAQDDPGDSTDYVLPTMTVNTGAGVGFAVGSIYDKFGLPTQVDDITIQSLPFRGYYKIWNDWFRDQNMQDSLVVPTDDGPDAPTDFELQKRGRRHDYFTSCLPFPQKGVAVELPLGTSAPVIGTGNAIKFDMLSSTTGPVQRKGIYQVWDTAGATSPISGAIGSGNPTSGAIFGLADGTSGIPSELIADLSSATAATINSLRQAFQMQSLFELDARGGTRYVEILKAHFGVISPDFRLQRPEYLGGGETRINVHPVAQTSPTSGGDPQAQLAAFATTATRGQNIGFTKSFVEHGYVFGLVCARADITYQQGINRMWSRSTRYDFFWPKLQEIGEQAVLNQEIFAQGSSVDQDVFGYQERYAEYRYRPSEIHGEFRSTFATSLDYYHMAEEFSTLPVLNSDYIPQNTPVDRAIAVPSEPHLLFDAWIQMFCARPMLAYSVPASLGRF